MYFLILWIYGGGVCTFGCRCLGHPEEGVVSPGAEVQVVCEPSEVGVGTKLGCSSRTIHTLIHGTVSSALTLMNWFVDWLIIDYLVVCVEVSSRLSLLSHLTDLISLSGRGRGKVSYPRQAMTSSDSPASISQVLRLRACITKSSQEFALFSLSTGQLNQRVMDGKAQL